MPPAFAPVPASPAAAHPTAVVQKAKPAPHGWFLYSVRPGDTVRDLAIRTGTTNATIVSRNRLPGGGGMLRIGQRLYLPKTKAMAAAEAARARAARAKAAAARAAAIKASTHVVRSGDTLGAIAAKRGVSLAALLKANRLSSRSVIHPGQRLHIPGGAARAAKAARAASSARAAAATRTYTVRPGDTLSAIAARTRTPLATVYRLNGLSARSLIHPGQRIKVKGSSAARPGAVVSTRTYTVRSGETLSGIAARHGTTVAALMKRNRLRNANLVTVGQRLAIPVRAAAAATSSSHNTFAGRTYPDSIVRAAARNRAALQRSSVPSRSQTRAMIVATARRHGVDPRLALAISWQESGWNQRQVSVANAIGTMQVIPSSGEWASQMVGRRLNLLNTQDNITAGVAIIRSLTRSAKNLDQAIAGYYQGLYSVQRNGMYTDTKQYVAAIKAHRARM